MIDSTVKPKVTQARVVQALDGRPHFAIGNRCDLRQVPGHVVADALVVKDTLNAADGAHGDILIPELAVGEVHDVLLGDLANSALDVLGAEAAAGGDDLAANVLGDGGGAVEGEKDRSLELGLGTLHLSGGNVVAEAGPLAQSEVNQVIEVGQVLRNKVDTPETTPEKSVAALCYTKIAKEWLTQCRCSWWRNS